MSPEQQPQMSEKERNWQIILNLSEDMPILERTKMRMGFVLRPVVDKVVLLISDIRAKLTESKTDIARKEKIAKSNAQDDADRAGQRMFGTRTGRR